MNMFIGSVAIEKPIGGLKILVAFPALPGLPGYSRFPALWQPGWYISIAIALHIRRCVTGHVEN